MALYICRQCGIEFKRSHPSKFCSRKCRYSSNEFKKQIRELSTNPAYKEIKANNARKAAKSNIGREPWNKGIPRTQEVKDAISRANKGRLINEKNPNWKGDLVEEAALHSWVIRRLGKPNRCDFCATTIAKRYEWANRSGEYKRDVNDWYRLCSSCHAKFDKKRVGVKKDDRKELFRKRKLQKSS